MSLIFGLCLPRKIYLVSDSRLTMADGSYVDDFAKWLDLNQRLSVVVANNAHQASWFLRKIVKHIRINGRQWDFTDLEAYLRQCLPTLANEYYSETGEISRSVGFIFGGFEKNKKLEVESARLGDAMSTPVRQVGEGIPVTQSVDPDIMNAFAPIVEAATRSGIKVEAGTVFEVDLPKPRVLAVTINVTQEGAKVTYEDAACFDGIVFNPQYKTERVKLPSGLIGNLVFRDQSNEQGDDVVYIDYQHIIKYVHELLREKHWPTVGGEVLPLLVLPDSSGFATGKYVRLNENGEKLFGGIGQIDGKMHYYNPTGELKAYRFIHGYLDELNGNTEAKL